MLGNNIKKLRLSKEMTQEDLGKFLNKTKNNISQYETEKREPDNDTLKKIADLFEVSVDYLLGRDLSTSNLNLSHHQINIPKEYTDKYKVTSRDKKQYLEEMKKSNEAFFMNDELNEEAKKEMLDLMSELFWEAKTMNKRKK